MKFFLIIFFSTIFPQTFLYSQKKLNVTITLDSGISPKSINIKYFNGKFDVLVTDTVNKNILKVKGIYYSAFSPLTIEYRKGNSFYNNCFFVNESPAKINIKLCNSKCKEPFNFTYKNTFFVTDTSAYKMSKEIFIYRLGAAERINQFFIKFSPDKVFSNDSLKNNYFNLY